MKTVYLIPALCSLALPVAAQIAPGEGLMTSITGPSSGVAVVDAYASGSMIFATGFPAQADQFNSGVIDPVTGELWTVGVLAGEEYKVFRTTLSGLTAASIVEVVDLFGVPKGPDPSSLTGIDLDKDGNVFVCDASNIWQLDRITGAVTAWDSGILGTQNALTIDRTTNRLWTTVIQGDVSGVPVGGVQAYNIDLGPSAGVQLFDPAGSGVGSKSASITYDGAGLLYVGTFSDVYSVDTATGAHNVLNVTGSVNGYNSLDYDRLTGLLHTAGGTIGATVYTLVDPVSGIGTEINNSQKCLIGFDPLDFFCQGVALNSSVDVNDYLHSTQMFPRAASISTGFQLEVAANGMPGDFAAIAVGEVNGIALASPIVLGSYGACGLGGNFVYSTNVPGGVLPGFITSLGIGTATYDFATGVFSYGSVETLTLNP